MAPASAKLERDWKTNFVLGEQGELTIKLNDWLKAR